MPVTLDFANCGFGARHVVVNFDFTGNLSFAGMSLQRLPKTNVPNSPVAVVYTKAEIIDGHNGIFKPQFIEFLTKYIDFIEGKNLALRKERWEQRRDKARSQLEGAAIKQNANSPDGTLAPPP